MSVHTLSTSLAPSAFGHLIKLAIADGEDRRPEFLETAMFQNTSDHQAGISCEEAQKRALEIAPALLALANWPLDDHDPVECQNGQYASAPTSGETQVEVFEIPMAQSIISVMATAADDTPFIVKQSSSQLVPENQYPRPLDQQIAVLDLDSLDEIRGGFELEGSSLKFSIGIERAVFINGNLVATTVLVPKDIQQATNSANVTNAVPGISTSTLGVIQNGPGNNISTQQIGQNVAGTVIQNTLNDQKIQNVTTINATVNSMQTLRTMSLHNTIQTGIVGSLRR